jgi:hypothetical protein
LPLRQLASDGPSPKALAKTIMNPEHAIFIMLTGLIAVLAGITVFYHF